MSVDSDDNGTYPQRYSSDCWGPRRLRRAAYGRVKGTTWRRSAIAIGVGDVFAIVFLSLRLTGLLLTACLVIVHCYTYICSSQTKKNYQRTSTVECIKNSHTLARRLRHVSRAYNSSYWGPKGVSCVRRTQCEPHNMTAFRDCEWGDHVSIIVFLSPRLMGVLNTACLVIEYFFGICVHVTEELQKKVPDRLYRNVHQELVCCCTRPFMDG